MNISQKLQLVRAFMSCIPDEAWEIVDSDDGGLESYAAAYKRMVGIDVPVHSSIPLGCSNEAMSGFILDAIAVGNAMHYHGRIWLLPYLASSPFWCSVESEHLAALISKRIELIRRSGICIISTHNDRIFDFELGETALECRMGEHLMGIANGG